MQFDLLAVSIYLLPLGAIWGARAFVTSRRTRRAAATLQASRAAGLTEPASLHPVINPNLCLGCATCVTACPESDVLGLIGRKARLINPSHCIGHGACKEACPTGAIELVLGSARRGVDIPKVGPDFQTNVPGLFVAGELGGMGLIRNAIEQGRQAVESVTRGSKVRAEGEQLDLVVVGAGPAGLSASLAAMEQGLRFVTLEQESFGGTVAHYPRGKIVMTAPAHLPLIGPVQIRETTKEALLGFWSQVLERTGLTVREQEQVESISQGAGGFEVKSARGIYRTRAVLLAIGRRGTPRKLGVPGEERTKVVYRLIDPEQYRGQRVLVVGGGDSALEAATSIADEPGTEVTLSYRSETFGRAKPKNRERVAAAQSACRLRVLLSSQVERIDADAVQLNTEAGSESLPNDAVIVCAGGVLPTPFLKAIGVEVETKYGTPLH